MSLKVPFTLAPYIMGAGSIFCTYGAFKERSWGWIAGAIACAWAAREYWKGVQSFKAIDEFRAAAEREEAKQDGRGSS
jgi:hypothetical protein